MNRKFMFFLFIRTLSLEILNSKFEDNNFQKNLGLLAKIFDMEFRKLGLKLIFLKNFCLKRKSPCESCSGKLDSDTFL